MNTTATALRIQTSAAPTFCIIPLHFPIPWASKNEITMTGRPVASANTAGMIPGRPLQEQAG